MKSWRKVRKDNEILEEVQKNIEILSAYVVLRTGTNWE